jgi:hypothetical protein
MNPRRPRLCIVSRDPSRCAELLPSLQALLGPDEEIEIIMDRRRATTVPAGRPGEPAARRVDRRRSPGIARSTCE